MLDLVISIISATFGQILLSRQDPRGLILYALAVLILLIGLWRDKRFQAASLPDGIERLGPSPRPSSLPQHQRRLWRWLLLPFALLNAIFAFLAASDNTYRWYGVLTWLLAVAFFLIIFWERTSERPLWQRLGFGRTGWLLGWTALALIAVILLGFWFRFWQLADLPPEMTSDHVEKLLDVHDLVTGKRPIFFVRNTGREPWQFYWTLALIRLFDLETKFFALKLGTTIVGLLMLPGVYLLGRELFDRWVGLWATLFAAVASWPVILSRIGLRFPFAPAVTAWSLLFLLRGLRYGRRNDFLLLGLSLGIGLHGYTAFRAMPLAIVVCWMLALIIRPSSLTIQPRPFLRNALLAVLIAVVVFIPLGRFSLEHPDDFWRRSVSRMVDPLHPIPDSPLVTLGKNLLNLALMFHWRGDDVWVNTLAYAPILDPLLGGLLILGLVVLFWRALRLRDPLSPLLLIAGVILLLPSALSLAYPVENPSVVRAGGAIPVVMIIAALPVGLGWRHGLLALRAESPGERPGPRGSANVRLRNWQRLLMITSALALAIAVIAVNHQRYFHNYREQYRLNALNTTEIAAAIRGFVESGGDASNAWIIAWPYWIDTRGVGIELGDPPWNNVILEAEELEEQASAVQGAIDARPRFYVLHPQDAESLEQLRSLFPRGWPSLYISHYPSRDFVMYYVPRTPSRAWLQDFKGSTADAR
jgi:hypothetical protein